MECAQVQELLPWLLNESLAAAERDELTQHLRQCDTCATELAETGAAWRVFGAHPAADRLVAYALDGALDEAARGEVEAHLAQCAQCRDDLADRRDGAQASVFDASTARSPAAATPRILPLAAGLLLGLVGGALGWRLIGPGPTAERRIAELESRLATLSQPAASIPILELTPIDDALRGSGASLSVPPQGATVVLLSASFEPYDEYRLQILDRDDRQLWQQEEVARAASGEFTLHLPASSLSNAAATLVVEGRRGGEWLEIDRYRISGQG